MIELPKISIVVPVYNVEAFVGRCVDSVMAQNYPALECVIVDDCGNDKSMEIVRARLENYHGNIDFKILRHERNRGLSAARNTGIHAATGDYVWFVDSDDFIADDVIFDIFRRVGENRPDIVVFSYAMFKDGNDFRGDFVRVPAHQNVQQMLTGTCVAHNENWGAQFRIYRREFLRERKIEFHEGLIHEDVEFFIDLLLAGTDKFFQVPCCAYFYRQARAGSIMASGFSERRMDSLIYLAQRAQKLFAGTDSPELKRIFAQICYEMFASLLSGIRSRQTKNRWFYLRKIAEQKMELAGTLKFANQRAAKIFAGTLKISPIFTLAFFCALNSVPVRIFRFVLKKVVNKFSRSRQ